jgi:hypothetical protein
MSWCLACCARESGHTDTLEAANHVLTDAVLAGKLFTVVDQAVTVCSCPADRTLTHVAVDDVRTYGAVLAWV